MDAISLEALAKRLDVNFEGDPQLVITGVGTIQNALPGQLCFLDNPKYRKYLSSVRASVVILSPELAPLCPVAKLITDHPYHTYALAAACFVPPREYPIGIHPTAVVHPEAKVHPNASVGPYVVIEQAAEIREGAVIEAHCVIGPRCLLETNVHLFPRVTLYSDVSLGPSVVIHSGAVIGSDGFGIAKYKGRWKKVPQLGGVRIGAEVEIGANTTIDRGAIEPTEIGEGAQLDNQIQIGHNVKVGARTAIAGCVGIAGSTEIGEDCLIGGASGIAGHLQIADNVALTGMSMVTRSIAQPGVYSSGTGLMDNRQWKKSAVRFQQLDELFQRVEQLTSKDIHDTST